MRISDWSSDVCSSDLDTSAYDVDANLVRSVQQLKRRLLEDRPLHAARVDLGDARDLALDARSVDAIVTSPPYLNAIDYMRGHRISRSEERREGEECVSTFGSRGSPDH